MDVIDRKKKRIHETRIRVLKKKMRMCIKTLPSRVQKQARHLFKEILSRGLEFNSDDEIIQLNTLPFTGIMPLWDWIEFAVSKEDKPRPQNWEKFVFYLAHHGLDMIPSLLSKERQKEVENMKMNAFSNSEEHVYNIYKKIFAE